MSGQTGPGVKLDLTQHLRAGKTPEIRTRTLMHGWLERAEEANNTGEQNPEVAQFIRAQRAKLDEYQTAIWNPAAETDKVATGTAGA